MGEGCLFFYGEGATSLFSENDEISPEKADTISHNTVKFREMKIQSGEISRSENQTRQNRKRCIPLESL